MGTDGHRWTPMGTDEIEFFLIDVHPCPIGG